MKLARLHEYSASVDRGDFALASDIDPAERKRLNEYTTPRRALDGSLVYINDELGVCDDVE